MKDWIASNCDNIQALDLVKLRSLIERAWEAVPEDWLRKLAHSMPQRLQMCIERGGRSIGF